jgi:predicted transcriptional regulator
MTRILLSIKPKFVEKILSGEKRFEFRRSVPKLDVTVTSIVVYASSPVCRVVGEVEVKRFYSLEINELWNRLVGRGMDLTFDEFFTYFCDCYIGYAFELGKITLFSPVRYLSDFEVKRAPQNFCYLPDKTEGEQYATWNECLSYL